MKNYEKKRITKFLDKFLIKNWKRLFLQYFTNCKKLETVTFKGILPYAGSGIFDECLNLKEIHIPRGSLEHYIKIMPFYKDKFVEE